MNRLQIRLSMGALAVAGLAMPAAGAQVGDGSAPAIAVGNGRMVQGTVTVVAADKLTVKTQQGEIYQVAVSANTQVRKGRDPMKFADVHVGDGVGAMGEIDPSTKTVHALMMTVVTAEDLKKAKDALGKTFIAGTVTAIDEVKLTIKRSDGVEQVIQVDEDTSFRRGGRAMQQMIGGLGFGGMGAGGGRAGGAQRNGAPAAAPADAGEAITLADVKVGSAVAGPGALKNGVFFPTQLGVTDPGARRQRRPQDGSAPAGPGTTTPPAAPPPTTEY